MPPLQSRLGVVTLCATLAAVAALIGGCGDVRANAVDWLPADSSATGGASPLPLPAPMDPVPPAVAGSSPGTDLPEPPEPDPVDEPPALAGELCSPCSRRSDCGGSEDYCLVFRDNDQTYCGRHCELDGSCPEHYECVALRNAPEIEQCVPVNRDCPAEPVESD